MTMIRALPAGPLDPLQTARAARLRYISDDRRGIRRRWDEETQSFSYVRPDGQRVTDEAELDRIASLAIPPAWTDVWISPYGNSHLQATGRDARGRKQYRYHARWRAVRDETKFWRMVSFGEALPSIRHRVALDLARPGLPRERLLATVIQLLDLTHMRVGNQEYARENGTFGLTTLRAEHVEVRADTLRLRFRGKGGKVHDVGVRDRRLAGIIRRCRDLPGEELFQYIDETGELCAIDSEDVNEYLRSITGQEFTAKDFRTWAGTLVAACALRAGGACANEAQGKRQVIEAIRAAALHLGNTEAICRKCYVHPGVIAAYLGGEPCFSPDASTPQESAPVPHALREDEAWALDLLRRLLPDAPRHGAA